MIKFPFLQKTHEFELGYGLHNIYITGGFGIENIESLDIHLIDITTSETITLTEKSCMGGDTIQGERAVLCYSFTVHSYSKFKLTIANPEIIVMKRNYEPSFMPSFGLSRVLRPNTVVPNKSIFVIIK